MNLLFLFIYTFNKPEGKMQS